MSDYIPNPNDRPNDRRDPLNPRADRAYDETAPTGNGIYVVLGSLVVAVLVAGFLMFTGPRTDRVDQANVPMTAAPVERTTITPPAPATPAPVPVTPAAPRRP